MSSKTAILIFFVCLFLLPMVTAASSIENVEYMFKYGNETSIYRPCFNNANTGTNGWCSAKAQCQLTVTDPNNIVIVSGANMTNKISTHNFTIPSTLLQPGVYKADMACVDESIVSGTLTNLTGYDTFFFGVNNAGTNYNTNASVYFLLGILIILLLAFSFASYFMEEALKFVFLVLAVLMIPVILWVSLDIARNSFMGSAVINVLSTSFVVSLACFAGICFYVLWSLMMQFKIQKTMGIPHQPASPAYWQKKETYKKQHKGEEYE